jgi:bifunctional non-homologous end joining protein LigD
VRARPQAPVATPLAWDELRDRTLTAQRFTISNLFRRLGQKADPWRDIARHAQPLAAASAALARQG